MTLHDDAIDWHAFTRPDDDGVTDWCRWHRTECHRQVKSRYGREQSTAIRFHPAGEVGRDRHVGGFGKR